VDDRRLRALLWAVGIAAYLYGGLEITGWFFYEASHFLNIDWLYWGYSIFRGAGYAFGLWEYQSVACLIAGLLVFLLSLSRRPKPEVGVST